MPNWCFTTYKIISRGEENKEYLKLKKYLDENWEKELWIGNLANYYGVDFESLGISARGWVSTYSEDDGVITLDVESAWDANDLLFDEINKATGNKLIISLRAEEPNCDLWYIRDEGGFFPEKYYVDCYGGSPEFEPQSFETLKEVVDLWCKMTGEKRNGRTDEQMLEVIEEWESDEDDIFFNVHEFAREDC